MPARRKDGVVTLAFGAESDQAFMVYALAAGKVDTEDRRYELVRSDVQRLDEEATNGRFDVTAVTYGGYPFIRDRYLILSCGGTYGDHQGPVLVARRPIRAGEVDGLEVAVPGKTSAAAIALRLWLPQADLRLQAMQTREISLRVRAGHARSGVIINEDQITYRNYNLLRVVDLGQWWGDVTEGLPLALGTYVIRRDLSFDERSKIALDIKRSIAYALGHREEALDWSMQYMGSRDRDSVDLFVGRYVNDLSLDCGERGRQASTLLFQEAHRLGILEDLIEPVFHGDEEAATAAEAARKVKEAKKAAARKAKAEAAAAVADEEE
jgi:1,4-dihydroxy-6-naphthoate synthase